MQTTVSAHNMELTTALKTYAEEKIARPLTPMVDGTATKLRIELTVTGVAKDHRDRECHVTLLLPKLPPINISEVDSDMYKAIDLAHDRILELVKKQLDKARAY